jgi:hypothetical protein
MNPNSIWHTHRQSLIQPRRTRAKARQQVLTCAVCTRRHGRRGGGDEAGDESRTVLSGSAGRTEDKGRQAALSALEAERGHSVGVLRAEPPQIAHRKPRRVVYLQQTPGLIARLCIRQLLFSALDFAVPFRVAGGSARERLVGRTK